MITHHKSMMDPQIDDVTICAEKRGSPPQERTRIKRFISACWKNRTGQRVSQVRTSAFLNLIDLSQTYHIPPRKASKILPGNTPQDAIATGFTYFETIS